VSVMSDHISPGISGVNATITLGDAVEVPMPKASRSSGRE